ncbi:TonB-dependent hemoglobin/transferrin/lactoferrin family receptor [Acidovorax sp. CCYZU-2555]|uniref:TonB-dependent hemoglobin/transferrin/lactoferrin family receptor n=1 Tax=Acidovorax sp. CCYZU-2555 TaxID=2835042 RepID=UPI001BCAF5D1|nr:TonB-dependent hemoglobin/transferrin/lactoferrin family receptor [Acidovorax sp. CCYZU-2555]MBS7781469.1 TonB-dependent hemoglobin/transferrin/lactoferrin family receptor [Acidovorax sp. CCYZU-2555]
MFRLTRLHAAILGVCAAAAAPVLGAQEIAPAPTGAHEALAPVVITATRRPTDALTTPATVAVIDEKQLRENLVTDFSELLRYEPGIAVKREPRGRGGEAGIEVRGIGGQRLGLRVDGVRLPGGHAAAGANLGQLKLDPLSLSRVEVLKGPASSLYGSDALAGVVLFRTLSPQDFLSSSTDFAGAASTGFDGRDNSRWGSAQLAFRAGATQNLLSLSARDGQGLKNHGDSALHPDPQDTRQRNLLLKSVLDIDARQSLTLTGEHYEQAIQTNQQSLIGPISGGTRITRSRADDSSQRDRLGLAYRYAPDSHWFDHFSAQIDYQRSRSDERTADARQPPGAAPALLRDASMAYREPQWSGSLQFDGRADAGGVTHRWLAGMDLLAKSVSLYNNALQRTAAGTGATQVIDGEVFPRRTAPESDTRNIGLFVQDELALGDGKLRLTPSLRYDSYRISPRPDALFANANVAGTTPVGLARNAWTPRLGLTYEWQPRQVVYANYVTGFRMPTPEQLNRVGQVAVATFIHDFTPNPQLQPERSRGLELGLRGESQHGSYELSAFYNRYTDFINTEMTAFIPAGHSGGSRAIRRFQSRNIGEVAIYGIEAKGQAPIGHWFDAADRWRLIGALQWSVGNDKSADQPLNSIQPARLVAGLRWDQRGGNLGATLTGNLVAGKRRVNEALAQTGPTAPVPLRTAGYATLDLSAYWRIAKQATLHLALYNLFDRQHHDWSTVSGLTGNDARLAAYTAPGRTAAISLRVDF